MSTNPIVITPSTSVVLVNTADYSGNPVVLLPNLAGPGALGRIITIRDNDGGSVDPAKSIYLSTTGGALFQPELSTVTLSTIRITQPYGFITLTPRLNDGLGNTNYGLMNVYAFPEASPAAYINTFNANFSYLSTLSTANLAVSQDTIIQGNLAVGGSISYVNPGATVLDIGRVNTNVLSTATVLGSNLYGVNLGVSTINTSSFVVRDSGAILMPNAASWSNAASFAGAVDPNSLTLGNPAGGAGAQIGLSSNFFGLRAFTSNYDGLKFSTTMVMRDGTLGVNLNTIDNIGTSATSNYSLYVRGATQMSNLGINNNIVHLKTAATNGCNVEVNQFGSSSNFRIDTSSNITEGFFGGLFVDQYKWLSVTKGGSVQFWTAPSGNTSARMTIDSAGRVGIGTTMPATPLDISGVLTLRGGTTSSNFNDASNTYISFAANGSTTDWVNLRQIGGANTMTLAYDFYDDSADVRFVLRNNPSAPGGMPWEVLRVDNETGSSGTMQVTQFSNATTTSNPALSLRNTSNTHNLNFFTNNSAGSFNGLVQANDKSIIFHNGTQNTGNLVIAPWSASGVASGLRMNTSGQVGIACTPNISYNLDVSGNSRINNGGITFDTTGNNAGSIAATGEPTSDNKLLYSATRGNGGHIFNVNSGEAMRINYAGDVGIGCNAPSVKLDVNGSTKITGDLTVTGTITGALSVVPTGCIMMWYTNTAPTGWLLCDGSAILGTYTALISLIGANTPNMKGRVPVGRDTIDASFNTIGNTGGAKTHTLTELEIPPHTHGYKFPSSQIAQGGGADVVAEDNFALALPKTSDSTGGGQAHNNLQPYLVLNYIIKT